MTFQDSQLEFNIESDVFLHAKTLGVRKTEILLESLLRKLNVMRISQLEREVKQLQDLDINLQNIAAGE